jgi:hypothetical protein
LKDACRFWESIGERLTHACKLGTLAGKKEGCFAQITILTGELDALI